MAERFELVEKAIIKMVEDKKYSTLRDILLTINPADIAGIFNSLDDTLHGRIGRADIPAVAKALDAVQNVLDIVGEFADLHPGLSRLVSGSHQVRIQTGQVDAVFVHGECLHRLGHGILDTGLNHHKVDQAQDGNDKKHEQGEGGYGFNNQRALFIFFHISTPCNLPP